KDNNRKDGCRKQDNRTPFNSRPGEQRPGDACHCRKNKKIAQSESPWLCGDALRFARFHLGSLTIGNATFSPPAIVSAARSAFGEALLSIAFTIPSAKATLATPWTCPLEIPIPSGGLIPLAMSAISRSRGSIQ